MDEERPGDRSRDRLALGRIAMRCLVIGSSVQEAPPDAPCRHLSQAFCNSVKRDHLDYPIHEVVWLAVHSLCPDP